jgi:hypothetical protein
MTFEHFVRLLSPAIAFAGFLLVILQLRRGTKQRELDSLVKIYDINRQLITLGFSHPQLFAVLQDSTSPDPVWEKHYLQLWLNQLSLVHSYMYESIFKREIKDSLIRDLSDFMVMDNMQRHWLRYKTAYSAPFQKFVDGIIEKVEPPAAAQLSSGI